MKKYLVKNKFMDGIIHEVEIERETDKCVFIRSSWYGMDAEHKNNKVTDYETYHDTYEQAYEALTAKISKRIENARHDISKCEAMLDGLELANAIKKG